MTTNGEAAEKSQRLAGVLFRQLVAEEHRLTLMLRTVQERIVQAALLCEEAENGDDGEKREEENNNPGERACSTGVTKNTRANEDPHHLLEDAIWH